MDHLYAWRVRLTRGPRRSIYWRTFPRKLSEAQAAQWARRHGAVLRRVLGSGEPGTEPPDDAPERHGA